ncbi:hypothetical protein [Williamsia sp. D3]|uniref:hypothetical protein n=1 Tax=Williamsia sp. D3 TaxID=1313067 RepID=UPI0003D37BFF|nr:hypothetical protein [Williamsia sp. D3]ETD32298.1 hypothetical protein W823_14435 [Williamsia sp. D3]PZT97183.1 MAG: hypothetical protein DI630_22260 [Gordonia sp. (in: high G+C Gram-positive bacteria)]
MSTTNRPEDAAAGDAADPAPLLRPTEPGGRGRRVSFIGANLAMVLIMASVVGLLLGVVVLVELLT